ncbi:MAG: site-specific DNA-methyltransferase, partial [Chloroflexi bacterium]|nr:site-specific DNA-methyltransferase [Chloroflexota bacterium]
MIINGNSLSIPLADKSVQCAITSPPYWGLRDYGSDAQLGLESTPEKYVENMVNVFREVWRVLKDDGVLWLNLGDSYAGNKKGNTETNKNPNAVTQTFEKKLTKGYKAKDLVGIPWMVAFALRADGWYLRQDIIWHKRNPMPESVTDRCTKSHEYIFLLTKNARYYYDHESIKENSTTKENRANGVSRNRTKKYDSKENKMRGLNKAGKTDFDITETRNKRSVWDVTTKPYKGAHFATFPADLVEPMVLAGSREGDIVLDPFS